MSSIYLPTESRLALYIGGLVLCGCDRVLSMVVVRGLRRGWDVDQLACP